MDLAYKNVFDLSPSAGIITDESGMIVQVNNSAEQLFGYDRALLIGQKIDFLIPQLIQNSSRESFGEFLAQRQNGITFPIELNWVSFESENTALTSWVATDISKTKELLTELKERVKERLTLLLVTETLFKFESLEEIFVQALPHIAQGLQHSEHAGVRIKLKDKIEYKTDNFVETENPLSAMITYNGKEYGILEVCYIIPFPNYADSPFLKEEKELIDALAKLFSIFLDQWHTLTKLHEKDALIRKITEQIPGNTYQFELDAMGNIKFLFASKGFATNNLSVSADEMRSDP
ncbi:MAG TPA: PAS domain S-box protein, partial [Flavobacterium sp.]|nr:PAS domain S-box protein [Flavobacterium sp.]